MTLLASVTATGDVGDRPAAVDAATAGQSMHQMASTRDALIRLPHAPTRRCAPLPAWPAAPADPAASRNGHASAAPRHFVAADPGLQPSRCAVPVAAGDQQRATLLRARATTARARVGDTERPPRPSTTRSMPSISTAATSTGSARFGIRQRADSDPLPFQLPQADPRRADRRWPHALPPPSPPPPCSTTATGHPTAPPPFPSAMWSAGPQSAIRERQQTFRLGQHIVRRHLAASAGTNLPGYRRHLAAQVFYLFSAVNPMPIQAHRSRHNSTFHHIRIIAYSKICSIQRVNTRPPTPSSVGGAVRKPRRFACGLIT